MFLAANSLLYLAREMVAVLPSGRQLAKRWLVVKDVKGSHVSLPIYLLCLHLRLVEMTMVNHAGQRTMPRISRPCF